MNGEGCSPTLPAQSEHDGGMRIAVTGGSGFIGSHVVDHLVADGHVVVVVDNRPPDRPGVEFARADLGDLAALTTAFRDCEVVFHLAAYADVNDVSADPAGAVAANVGGTANVWEAARQTGARRAVLASTVWVYGAAVPGECALDEDVAFLLGEAGHLYTATKLAAELVAQSYRDLYGLPFTILRYGIPYGPRMRDELVIAKFVAKVLRGEPLTIEGDGSQARNYLYVEDLAEAHVLALRPEAENQVFNLEGTVPISVRHLAEAVTEVLGSDSGINYLPGRVGDYAGRTVSVAKTSSVLGWEAHTPFDEGLRRYVDWYTAEKVDTPQPVATPLPATTPDAIASTSGSPPRRWRRWTAAAGAVVATTYAVLTMGVSTAAAHGLGVAHAAKDASHVYVGVRLGATALDDPALVSLLADNPVTAVVDADVARRRPGAIGRLEARGVDVANGGSGRDVLAPWTQGDADIVAARRTLRAEAGRCCEEFVAGRRINMYDLATARLHHERVVVPARVRHDTPPRVRRGGVYELDLRSEAPADAARSLQMFLATLGSEGLPAAPFSALS